MVDLSGTWIKPDDLGIVASVHEAVIREFGKKALQYTDTAGAPEPREELKKLLMRLGFTKHEVFFTASLADSLRIIADVHLDEGDCILPEDPTQREVIIYAKCGRPKAVYIQPFWRNPDGYIYQPSELKKAADSAPLAIYDLTYGLLEGEIPYVPEMAVAVGALDVLFPGLQLAFVAVPQSLAQYYINRIEAAYLHPPTYMQYLFYAVINTGAAYAILKMLKRRQVVVKERLEAATTPYFAWTKRGKAIFLRHGALPGSEFSWRGQFGEYVRLGLTSATEEELADFLSEIPV